MEYVNGRTLKELMKSGEEVSIDKALHIIQQIAEALYYAWEEAELIHRDVKPDNIMINQEGLAKLTDLGLAMNKSDWHEDMEISGSPSYMSPEQFAGEVLDTRSDIYSLGITLYQVLGDKLPFEGETIKTIVNQHFNVVAQPLNKVNPEIPLDVAELVNRMIAKSPEDRFANMEELLKSIWKIRQQTAPSTEMIPNVHTISIKRLEYDLQTEKVERKKQEQDRLRMLNRQNRKFKLVLFTLIALVAMLFTYIIHSVLVKEENKKLNQTFATKLHKFEQLVDDNSLEDYSFLAEQGEHLIREAINLHTDKSEEYVVRINLVLSKVKSNRLSLSNRELKKKALQQGEIHNLVLDKENMAKKIMQLKEELAKIKRFATHEVSKSEKFKESYSSENTRLSNKLSKVTEELVNLKKEILLLKVYSQVKAGRFDLADGYISLAKNDLLASKNVKSMWLSDLSYWVSKMKQKYELVVADKKGSIQQIVSNEFLDLKYTMMGAPYKGLEINPNDKMLRSISVAVLKSKLKRLSAYYEIPTKKENTQQAAKDLLDELKDISGVREIESIKIDLGMMANSIETKKIYRGIEDE
jgi:serine/threonine protein kinase